ncbi:hypothetical protein [Klebsiella pneumoniae]|uniref:hypothetical protein n=1 Tax=Klebsiella pneumoniae TaxID=573 RepID=UPI001E5FB2E8|nr:hypothetical protein [Klebsiella pneumoniae]
MAMQQSFMKDPYPRKGSILTISDVARMMLQFNWPISINQGIYGGIANPHSELVRAESVNVLIWR